MMRSVRYPFLIVLVFFINDLSAQTNVLLIARNTGEKVLATNDTIRVFGFAVNLSSQPIVPGPTIYANEGDSVHIDLFNVSQGAPHTIHLHGLDVDQQNDGVGHLSFEVAHMDHGYYHFKAPHAGTYLYHCHVTSPIHVQAGMYGMVIIRPPGGGNTTWQGGYNFDIDFPLLTSEIDTVWHRDSVLNHAHDTSMMINFTPVPLYNPDYFLVNGLSDQQLDGVVELNTSVGAMNYIRFANLGFYKNQIILPAQLNARIIDTDGRPLPIEETTDTVIVYPGERYGIYTMANTEFNDSIQINYIDLNGNQLQGTQYVDVNINGFVNVDVNKITSEFKIYPNPTQGNLQIELITNHNVEAIELFNLLGKKIKSYPIQSQSSLAITIDISDFTDGVYIVKSVSSSGKSLEQQKIILLK